jgi:murein DD-endopeptidase MepM/ murein hydrolase activator NlpD
MFIKSTISRRLFKTLLFIFFIVIAGYLLPNNVSSPIAAKDIEYWDSLSFWHYPWGQSGVHKGIDIFCKKGTDALSPVSGFIISKGYGSIAGNYIYIIGPKWRTYYFAHLDTILVKQWSYVKRGDVVGKVGNTGNAIDKPTHLHFSIKTIFPYFWLYDRKAVQGWRKIFYINPERYLK